MIPSDTPSCRWRQLLYWLHKATTWQMIGRCPVPISLTDGAHLSARLGAFFYWTRCFENNVPFDDTIPIYLLWKLGLGFGLDSELHYFSIFSRRIRKVSTLSSENFTDGNVLLTEHLHLWPTFLLQKVLVYLQPLSRNPPRKLPNAVKLRCG